MTIQASTLRPGLLVSLKTSTSGNVAYTRRDLDTGTIVKDGAQVARWETERVITDPTEHKAGRQVQGKASTLIRRVCAKSAFGLLCPQDREDELEAAIKEARDLIDAFNASASLMHVSCYVITGRVAQDDVEAVRAINSEVRELMDEMKTGIESLDVTAVRAAATKARGIGQMLNPEAAARVQIAIDAARATATKIKAAGEQAAQEIDKRTLRTLAEARTAFLDLEEAQEVKAPKARGRAVDLDPSVKAACDEYVAKAKKERRELLDLEPVVSVKKTRRRARQPALDLE